VIVVVVNTIPLIGIQMIVVCMQMLHRVKFPAFMFPKISYEQMNASSWHEACKLPRQYFARQNEWN
jgi:hypothetical protein